MEERKENKEKVSESGADVRSTRLNLTLELTRLKLGMEIVV